MNRILIGLLLLAVGVLHIVAAHKEWGWYVNSYQVKPILQSSGKAGLKGFTYLMCAPCIGYGFYLLVTS